MEGAIVFRFNKVRDSVRACVNTNQCECVLVFKLYIVHLWAVYTVVGRFDNRQPLLAVRRVSVRAGYLQVKRILKVPVRRRELRQRISGNTAVGQRDMDCHSLAALIVDEEAAEPMPEQGILEHVGVIVASGQPAGEFPEEGIEVVVGFLLVDAPVNVHAHHTTAASTIIFRHATAVKNIFH